MTTPPAHQGTTCGVLAFGSLIWEPGELASLTKIGEVECLTPWHVEFARSSKRRHWAPTLVKVAEGRAVRARVMVYKNDPELVKATLAKRECIDLERRPQDIQVCEVDGVQAKPIWYTALRPNIADLRPHCLARLAIASVKPCPERNGVLYLRKCLELRIETTLSAAYREEILRISRCQTLKEAEEWAASG